MNTTRKNILSVLALGIVGVLLVAGAFFINSRINQKESVAPTAPESKPAAGSCTLEFTVSGPTPSPTPPGVCIDTYADVMIIIDRSDSMNKLESGKKKIEWVKESANNLIDAYGQASGGRIRFGVVVFGMKGVASSSSDIYAARTLSAPTNNYTQLKQIISNIAETDSGTCIECGLRLANTELEKSASGTARVAILLSDGDATYTWDKVQDRAQAREAAYAAADAGRAKAIRYITARFGTSTVGETVMKTIAGTTGFYAYHPTTQEWSSALVGLGEQICKPAPSPTPTPTPSPTPTPVPACGSACSGSTQCPTGMTCSSGVCRNPSCTSSTTCLCPTPTPTPTPSPTPSPTPLLSCGSTCVLDGDCPASMTCSSGVCRNPSCTSSTTCLCPTPTPSPTPSPTPVPYCGSSCSSDSQCPASMICSSGVCRNPSCTGESSCICPTPTPTPTPTPPAYVAYCSQTCSHNGDCTSPLVCSNGQCRNPSCTGESSCQCPTNPPVFIAQSTPQPTVEPLPTAGSTIPTMAIISVGVVMILISIFAFVTI